MYKRQVLGHGKAARVGGDARAVEVEQWICRFATKSRFFTFWRDFLAHSFQSSLSENMSTKTARGDTRDEEPRQSAFARSSSSRDAREQASEAAWSVDIARATMSVAAAAKMALAFAELTGGVKFDGKKHHAEMSRFSCLLYTSPSPRD